VGRMRENRTRRPTQRNVARDGKRSEVDDRHGVAFLVGDEGIPGEARASLSPAGAERCRGHRQQIAPPHTI